MSEVKMIYTTHLINFSDCWYFYALNPLDRFLSGRIDTEPDQTIEILMTDLDPEIMETFTKSKALNGVEATEVKLPNVFPP